MEKSNIIIPKEGPGGFLPYAFELDYARKPAKRRTRSPAVVHISRKKSDRRNHRRYPAVQGAFALLRSGAATIADIQNMNMGDIAFAVMRSHPARIGQILNISEGGLVFQYDQDVQGTRKPSCLDILLADCRYYLDNLAFEIVADVPSPDETEFDSVRTGLLSVKFKDLTARQQKQLNHFLKHHTHAKS